MKCWNWGDASRGGTADASRGGHDRAGGEMTVENCRARHRARLVNVATLEITEGWGCGQVGPPISPPVKPGIGSFEDRDPLPWALPVSPSPGPQSAFDPLSQKADQCK